MLNINQIKVAPLLDAQKIVVDLRTNVKATDKNFPQTQLIINAATSRRDWKEPEQIEVRNIAGHDLNIDNTKIPKDGIGKVYGWQYIAVLRFLEAVNPEDHNAAVEKHVLKSTEDMPARAMSPAITPDDVAKIVVKTLTDMGIKGVSILIALAFLLFCSGAAKAQSSYNVYASSSLTYAVNSSPTLYHSMYVAGLNGGTNAWSGTETFTNSVTNSIVIITNANWTIINGTETNVPTYTTNVYVTATPGLVSLENYDEAQIYLGFSWMGLALGNAGVVTSGWDYSPDGINWQINALTIACATNTINASGTNYFFTIGGVPGFLRLNNITCSGGFVTDVVAQVALKPYRTGP